MGHVQWNVQSTGDIISFRIYDSHSHHDVRLVGCFGLNDPLREYFSLYRAVSQREGERREK